MEMTQDFLRSEISDQKFYNEIIHFVTSHNIRNGEYEGNEYVIEKKDCNWFIIYSDYELRNGERLINSAEVFSMKELVAMINEYALGIGIKVIEA